MVEIKHKRQINDGYNWKCGSVCLEMIFDYFQINYNSQLLWESVKSPRPTGTYQMYALTYKLALASISHGLPCTIYKGNDLDILKKTDELSIPAILLVTQEKSKQGHFIVFKGINNGQFYFCDPDSGRRYSYLNDPRMHDIWRENLSANVPGHIVIVFNELPDIVLQCPYCNREIPVVYSSLLQYANGLICPHCDKLILSSCYPVPR